MKNEGALTIEMIKKALELNEARLPQPPIPLPLHESLWEDYKRMCNFTDEQMNKIFIKATYIDSKNKRG